MPSTKRESHKKKHRKHRRHHKRRHEEERRAAPHLEQYRPGHRGPMTETEKLMMLMKEFHKTGRSVHGGGGGNPNNNAPVNLNPLITQLGQLQNDMVDLRSMVKPVAEKAGRLFDRDLDETNVPISGANDVNMTFEDNPLPAPTHNTNVFVETVFDDDEPMTVPRRPRLVRRDNGPTDEDGIMTIYQPEENLGYKRPIDDAEIYTGDEIDVDFPDAKRIPVTSTNEGVDLSVFPDPPPAVEHAMPEREELDTMPVDEPPPIMQDPPAGGFNLPAATAETIDDGGMQNAIPIAEVVPDEHPLLVIPPEQPNALLAGTSADRDEKEARKAGLIMAASNHQQHALLADARANMPMEIAEPPPTAALNKPVKPSQAARKQAAKANNNNPSSSQYKKPPKNNVPYKVIPPGADDNDF